VRRRPGGGRGRDGHGEENAGEHEETHARMVTPPPEKSLKFR
jgi:hypothetical protein